MKHILNWLIIAVISGNFKQLGVLYPNFDMFLGLPGKSLEFDGNSIVFFFKYFMYFCLNIFSTFKFKRQIIQRFRPLEPTSGVQWNCHQNYVSVIIKEHRYKERFKTRKWVMGLSVYLRINHVPNLYSNPSKIQFSIGYNIMRLNSIWKTIARWLKTTIKSAAIYKYSKLSSNELKTSIFNHIDVALAKQSHINKSTIKTNCRILCTSKITTSSWVSDLCMKCRYCF